MLTASLSVQALRDHLLVHAEMCSLSLSLYLSLSLCSVYLSVSLCLPLCLCLSLCVCLCVHMCVYIQRSEINIQYLSLLLFILLCEKEYIMSLEFTNCALVGQ